MIVGCVRARQKIIYIGKTLAQGISRRAKQQPRGPQFPSRVNIYGLPAPLNLSRTELLARERMLMAAVALNCPGQLWSTHGWLPPYWHDWSAAFEWLTAVAPALQKIDPRIDASPRGKHGDSALLRVARHSR
tara:strand:- start:27180 stop:27575 length:396 start_codon:yes stop_codon:yes gene_type:complete